MPAFVEARARTPVRTAHGFPCRSGGLGQNLPSRRAGSFPLDENTRNLVGRALANDRDAVEALYERYRDRLRAALRKLVGPKYRLLLADSEDATQDAILSSLRRLNQFEYRGEGSFLAWLLKSAEFEIVRRVRAIETQKRSAGKHNVELDTQLVRILPGTEPGPDQLLDEQEMAERVRQALSQLPDREREVIVLRRYLELDTEEICAEMGLPTAGSVRALLSRAQARLSGLLSRDEDG